MVAPPGYRQLKPSDENLKPGELTSKVFMPPASSITKENIQRRMNRQTVKAFS